MVRHSCLKLRGGKEGWLCISCISNSGGIYAKKNGACLKVLFLYQLVFFYTCWFKSIKLTIGVVGVGGGGVKY